MMFYKPFKAVAVCCVLKVHGLVKMFPVCLFGLFQGDGRHLITNSKDQTIKLWDMRKFSAEEGISVSVSLTL